MSTNSVTDVALNGDGYFLVIDPDTNTPYYTRAATSPLIPKGICKTPTATVFRVGNGKRIHHRYAFRHPA